MPHVIDDECAFVHATGNFCRCAFVAFAAGCVGLDVGVGIDLGHVVRRVVRTNLSAMILAVLHVFVAIHPVPVLVI